MSSQASQSSSGSQGKQPLQEDLKKLVNDTVIFLLSQDHSKHPIKRQDIVKNCLREFGKAFKIVMDQVQVALKEVYGIDLVEPETSASNKHYILINSMEMTKHVDDLVLSEERQAQQILLLLALSNIFMNGGVVMEAQMWQFLTALDIMSSRKVHKYFGDVHKLLTVEFVRQMYLEYSRIPDLDPPKYQFRWGQRAEIEMSHLEILKFVTEMHGSEDIKMWTTQYKEMVKAETKKNAAVEDMMVVDDSDD